MQSSRVMVMDGSGDGDLGFTFGSAMLMTHMAQVCTTRGGNEGSKTYGKHKALVLGQRKATSRQKHKQTLVHNSLDSQYKCFSGHHARIRARAHSSVQDLVACPEIPSCVSVRRVAR